MKRREFIAGLGGAAAWPLVARGQQSAMPVIGILSGGSPENVRTVSSPTSRGVGRSRFCRGQEFGVRVPVGTRSFRAAARPRH